MQPILSFVGRSDSGKTTLLGEVIAVLKQHGFKIAVIKHAQNFELDKQGKDSWLFRQSGADTVILSSPTGLALLKMSDKDPAPQEIARLIDSDIDLILTEGFKKSRTTKIEVHRKAQGIGLLVPPEQLLAVVTDEPLDVNVPQFTRDDIRGLVNLIERWLQKQPKEEIELQVNDTVVPLNIFVRNIFSKTVIAMVSSLKGIGKIHNLHIHLKK
jgi:molybdopterin-guanine dinucleotide biosynthesis protein B